MELMIGILVSGIVVLMVAALGTMAYQSYNNLRHQSGIYNDSQFALQLIREAVRHSTSAPPIGITLSGTKNGVTFNYSMSTARRNP